MPWLGSFGWLSNARDAGISYLLQDEFTTTRAAGAVNATAAEPGPGNRVAADTASHLTIASGALTIDGGTSALYGDPGFWLPAVVREVGRTVIFHWRPTSTGQYIRFGLHPTQTTVAGGWHFNFRDGGAARVVDGGGGDTANLGVYSGATDYYFALRLLASTVNFYIKGGTWTTWALFYEGVVSETTTPVYPAILNYDHVGKFNFIRVPQDLWTPVGTDYSGLDKYIT